MSFFNIGKKKKEENSCGCGCCCSANEPEKNNSVKEQSQIKVLGSGCKKCNELEGAVKEALNELGMNDNIEHVTDFTQIAAYGVMSTPALVVDGKVVSFGKVLKKEDVIKILQKVRS